MLCTLKNGKAVEAEQPYDGQAIVFIHGLYLDPLTAFREMEKAFSGKAGSVFDTSQAEDDEILDKFKQWELVSFDYDFYKGIELNAEELSGLLRERYGDVAEVTLICHSVGGLVARAAVLLERLPFLKRVVMLGTPNFGEQRISQLGILSQMAFYTHSKLSAVFTRKRGTRDLMRVPKIFEELLNRQNAEENADPVEYITIPGTYFHKDRYFFDTGEAEDQKRWTSLFAFIEGAAGIVDALAPLFKFNLERPHDGVVEESSNNLIPADAGRRSEKAYTINYPDSVSPKTYAHVFHQSCDKLTHVMIQHNHDIIRVVADIVLADNVENWHKGLTTNKRKMRKLKVSFSG